MALLYHIFVLLDEDSRKKSVKSNKCNVVGDQDQEKKAPNVFGTEVKDKNKYKLINYQL